MEDNLKSTIEGIRSKYPADRITSELKQELDTVLPSPVTRANRVLNLIKSALQENEVSMYDVTCFCSAYLLSAATDYSFFKNETVEIQKLILIHHYLYKDEK